MSQQVEKIRIYLNSRQFPPLQIISPDAILDRPKIFFALIVLQVLLSLLQACLKEGNSSSRLLLVLVLVALLLWPWLLWDLRHALSQCGLSGKGSKKPKVSTSVSLSVAHHVLPRCVFHKIIHSFPEALHCLAVCFSVSPRSLILRVKAIHGISLLWIIGGECLLLVEVSQQYVCVRAYL